MNAQEKLAAALWEADRHVQTLQEALNEWDADPVTGWEALDANRSMVRLVDQLLFRFTKLYRCWHQQIEENQRSNMSQ
jgi:hypothetical protein